MSFASPFPEVDIPSTSVFDFLFGSVDDTDLDRVALVDAKSGSIVEPQAKAQNAAKPAGAKK